MKRSTASVLVLLAACAGSKTQVDITKPLDTKEASNAARAYQRGLEEKHDQNYPDAAKFFEAVRANFPYSQYAALAELALADMQYDQENWGPAATAYQDFVKSHPSHPKADYAGFRVGLSYYNDRAGDLFFLPPSYERDQTPVKQALDAFQKFTAAYPKSEFAVRARDMINECRERLAAHDRYVAGFYWKRKAWRGAAGRLIAIADNYGDLEGGSLRGDSLWRAAVAYQNANDPAAERGALLRLMQESPNDPHAKDAASLIKSLPEAPPAQPSPAPEPSEKAAAPETPPQPGK